MPQDSLDEEFLQECLSELRDGESVTIRVPVRQRRRVRERLLALGATEEDLMRLNVEGG